MLQLNYRTQITEVPDCMMGSIVNAALYYGMDYAYLYRGIWVFRFEAKSEQNDSFWKRLSTDELVNSHKQIELYHGLQLQRYEACDKEEFLSVLKKELQNGNPVAVGFDAFYCPWSGVYRRHTLLHFCLIVGLDEKSREILCADPYFMANIRPCPIDEMMAGFLEFSLFRKIQPVCGLETWKQDVLLCAKQKIDDDVFTQMREMKDEILNSRGFVSEIRQQNDKYSYELFYQIKYIHHSRVNHGEFLRYVAKHVGQQAQMLNKSAKCLDEAGKLWATTGQCFTKLAYLDDKKRTEKLIAGIAERMEKCIELEYLAATHILESIGE
ncbi:MAG: BtrH N-terminal domain-containing protein [Christensenellaceae bacterium]|jgi:hypothetical protein|nr:BtrH N-terminal domain-containing protein [Christensenellaceae bacterium]